MTDKETEIKAIAEILFDLNEELLKTNSMSEFNSAEKLKKNYVQREWIKYQITVAENKRQAAMAPPASIK